MKALMHDHLNPWLSVPTQPPYVAGCDWNSVCDHNARCRDEKYQLQLNVLPEPFIGSMHAPVVLLNLNPGFDEQNIWEHARPEFQGMIRNNYVQGPSDFPFYYLDPKIQSLGGQWWNGKLKWLIDSCGLWQVAQRIFCIEYFPYHSRRFRNTKQLMDSQRFGLNLVRSAMDSNRNAFLVIMRSRKLWEEKIPELNAYERKCALKNPRNPTLSPGNCAKFSHIVSMICHGK